MNKLRAQQRDVNVMMSQNKAGAKGPNNQQIDDPFQVREQKKRELLGDELENSIKGSAGTKRSGGSSGSARASGGSTYSSGRRGSLQINVVSDPDAKDEPEEDMQYQKPQEADNKSFLPAGSIRPYSSVCRKLPFSRTFSVRTCANASFWRPATGIFRRNARICAAN